MIFLHPSLFSCFPPKKHLNPFSFRFVPIFFFLPFIFHFQQSFDMATKSLFIRLQHFSVWITEFFSFFTEVLPFSMVSASDCFYSHRRKYSFINAHFEFVFIAFFCATPVEPQYWHLDISNRLWKKMDLPIVFRIEIPPLPSERVKNEKRNTEEKA